MHGGMYDLTSTHYYDLVQVGHATTATLTGVNYVATGNTESQTTDYKQTTISIGHGYDTDIETNSTQTVMTEIINRLLT